MLNIPLSDNTIHEKREGWHAPNLSQVTTILIWFIQGHKDPTEQLQIEIKYVTFRENRLCLSLNPPKTGNSRPANWDPGFKSHRIQHTLEI